MNPALSSLYGGSLEIELIVLFKGTVVNPALSSLCMKGHLEITLTVS